MVSPDTESAAAVLPPYFDSNSMKIARNELADFNPNAKRRSPGSAGVAVEV